MFDGLVAFTNNGSGYISESTGLPGRSTGFWIPDAPLIRDDRRYIYNDGLLDRRLTFVGVTQPIDVILQGSLVRVSLARWWYRRNADPDFEERCYVQLSGCISDCGIVVAVTLPSHGVPIAEYFQGAVTCPRHRL